MRDAGRGPRSGRERPERGWSNSIAALLPLFILAAPPPRQSETEVILTLLFTAIILFILLGWIWPAIWMYRDAKSRRTDAGVWLAIGLLAPVVAPIVWVMVRNDTQPQPVPPPYYYYPPPPPPQVYQQPPMTYHPQARYSPHPPEGDRSSEVVEADTEEAYERTTYADR